ncbi:MAG: TIGR02996 domain-containing protein [Planctomycetes bacterium]|nr:TIGR02996 domain-containing protein [Planctomycetota bacterium]
MARRKATKPAAPLAAGEEVGFLLALRENPDDRTVRAAYADWLEEHERPYEAAVQRDRAGVSEVWYKLRRKTDGLFAEPDGPGPKNWTRTGTRWRSLKALVPHVTNVSDRRAGRYLGVKWENLEVVVIEIRPVDIGALPAVVTHHPQFRSLISFTVPEPVAPSLPAAVAPPPEKRQTRRRR